MTTATKSRLTKSLTDEQFNKAISLLESRHTEDEINEMNDDEFDSLIAKYAAESVTAERKFSGQVYPIVDCTAKGSDCQLVSESETVRELKKATAAIRAIQRPSADVESDDLDDVLTLERVGPLSVPGLTLTADALLGSYNPDEQRQRDTANRADTDISERKHAVALRLAMPDGSWSIRNRAELEKALARFQNPSTDGAHSSSYSDGEIARHIVACARRLQLVGLLPATMQAEIPMLELVESRLIMENSGDLVGVLTVPPATDGTGVFRSGDDFVGPLEVPHVWRSTND